MLFIMTMVTVVVVAITVMIVVMMMLVLFRKVGVFHFTRRNGCLNQNGTAVDGNDEEVRELCGDKQGLAGCKKVSIHACGAVLSELEGDFSAKACVNDEGAELLCINVKCVAKVDFRSGEFVTFFKGAGYTVLIRMCMMMLVIIFPRLQVDEVQGLYQGIFAGKVLRAAAKDGKIKA